MDVKGLIEKIKNAVIKYKYAAIVLAVGLVLLLWPEKKVQQTTTNSVSKSDTQTFELDTLKDILESVQGAGKVEVLLSVASGEEIIYQTNQDTSLSSDDNNTKVETVIVTNSQRTESGLVSQINPPKYLGAIVVCEGADSATVRLAITQAVGKITGLGSDSICVLKMK